MSDPVKTWRYYLPSGDGKEWAEIVLVSTGMFAAVSDWGNYAFAWRSFGDCFRSFVVQIADSPSYVCSKLSRKEYDGEETEKAIRRAIKLLRRSKDITSEEARTFWDELNEYDVHHSEAGFGLWINGSEGAERIPDASTLYQEDHPPAVSRFVERILPRLAEVLRTELEAERHAA